MDETAMFLQAARVGGEAHKRVGDRTMTVDVGDWLRLVEMAERAGPRRQAAPIDIAQADPGIRDRLSAIIAAGFTTTDSGDGVSKPADERAMNVPHVAVACEAADLIATADRLLAVAPDANLEPSLYRDGGRWRGLVLVWWEV